MKNNQICVVNPEVSIHFLWWSALSGEIEVYRVQPEAEIMLTFQKADFNVAKISGQKKRCVNLDFATKKVQKIPFSTNDMVTSKYALLIL